MSEITAHWWTALEVAVGRRLDCRLGPLTLRIHHASGEWHVAHAREEDENAAPAQAELRISDGGLDEEVAERFVLADPDPRLVLVPTLMERPVVIRPRQPVFLSEGESTTLYVSTPVVLGIHVGSPGRLLRELPSVALSDTWFGPSTREGELCYAGRTHARRDPADLPRRAHRAVTPVRIENRVDVALPVDRLSLPVHLLSVFGASDGMLWTEALSLIRDKASDLAEFRVADGPPELAGSAERLSDPRTPRSQGGLVRAFSALFGDDQ